MNIIQKIILIIYVSFFVFGCAHHKGSISPNWGIADFDKYGEAYYLDLSQINIGFTKDQVVEEYGDKYFIQKVNNSNTKADFILRFTSYRATSFTDPVEKYVYVAFSQDAVVKKWEVFTDKQGRPLSIQPKSLPASSNKNKDDEYNKLRKLKQLYEDRIITQEEFELKKKEILNRI